MKGSAEQCIGSLTAAKASSVSTSTQLSYEWLRTKKENEIFRNDSLDSFSKYFDPFYYAK